MEDEFEFTLSVEKFADRDFDVDGDFVYTAKLLPDDNVYEISWHGQTESSTYKLHDVVENIREGYWIVKEV